jgi:outer membrane protein assembly factor BamB
MAYLCVPPGKWGNCSVCLGETGYQDGTKAEETDKTAGDKLWADSDGQLGQFSGGFWGRQAYGRKEVYGGDRGEQLPAEASAKAGISEDLLFFQESGESLEGI